MVLVGGWGGEELANIEVVLASRVTETGQVEQHDNIPQAVGKLACASDNFASYFARIGLSW